MKGPSFYFTVFGTKAYPTLCVPVDLVKRHNTFFEGLTYFFHSGSWLLPSAVHRDWQLRLLFDGILHFEAIVANTD